MYSASYVRPTYQFVLSYTTVGYWVTSTEYSITFPLSETVTAHAPCHMTSTGGKNSPHFWNPWPQFAYSLCHFQGATTKIKPCYRQKISFSHYEGYKVYCACAVSRDLCIGGLPKPHVTIFLPQTAYSLNNFYGATMTIKATLYWSIPMLKAVFGHKKQVQSKSVPKWRFFGNLKVWI